MKQEKRFPRITWDYGANRWKTSLLFVGVMFGVPGIILLWSWSHHEAISIFALAIGTAALVLLALLQLITACIAGLRTLRTRKK